MNTKLLVNMATHYFRKSMILHPFSIPIQPFGSQAAMMLNSHQIFNHQQNYSTSFCNLVNKKTNNNLNSQQEKNKENSKQSRRFADIERIQQWKKNATMKSEEKKETETKNLLSEKMKKTILPKPKHVKPRPSVLLKVDYTSVGRKKNGLKPKPTPLNDSFPQLFCAKLLKKLKLNQIDETLPKIAFAGRSNVGKSSLINSLVTKKGKGGKAAVSRKPGETQNVSYYQLLNTLTLVDFPGYGFAFVDEEKRLKWQNEIYDFLLSASKLKRVFLLIDVRHGFKESDYSFLTFLNQ